MANIAGRSTVYNSITSKEKLQRVNPVNKKLEKDFLEYLASTDKSQETIYQYRNMINVFWCWNLDNNDNTSFIDLKKRDFVRFQNYGLNECGWSPSRMKTVRSCLSSMSNYIENILDDEYPNYRSIIRKIAPPVSKTVRIKTKFTEDELQTALDYLVEEKEYMKACMLSLAMNSGRRKSELTRFKVSYFRPEYKICNGALYKTPEPVKTKGRGAGGKMLELYTLAAPFDKYLKMWMDERHRLKIGSQWLFPKRSGNMWLDEPIAVTTLNSWTSEFSEILGKPFYWHSMRHYFCTKLSSYDIPASVIQDIIGWDSAEMVNVYDDTDKDERFEKYFGAEGIKKVRPTRLEEL